MNLLRLEVDAVILYAEKNEPNFQVIEYIWLWAPFRQEMPSIASFEHKASWIRDGQVVVKGITAFSRVNTFDPVKIPAETIKFDVHERGPGLHLPGYSGLPHARHPTKDYRLRPHNI